MDAVTEAGKLNQTYVGNVAVGGATACPGGVISFNAQVDLLLAGLVSGSYTVPKARSAAIIMIGALCSDCRLVASHCAHDLDLCSPTFRPPLPTGSNDWLYKIAAVSLGAQLGVRAHPDVLPGVYACVVLSKCNPI